MIARTLDRAFDRLKIAAPFQALLMLYERYRRAYYLRAFLNRGRRFFYYEFWPGWMFYTPIFFMYMALGLRYRSLTLPTAANPGIAHGGCVGESKDEIYQALPQETDALLQYVMIDEELTLSEKMSQARAFIEKAQLSYPLFCKPDAGQRGFGCVKVNNETELERYLSEAQYDALVQEYCPHSNELGIFYVKDPVSQRSYIFSVTDKRFPTVTGDGERTLGELILDDSRASVIARTYLDRFTGRLDEVPPSGEVIRLVESGNHAQGTIFADGSHLNLGVFPQEIIEIVDQMDGFYMGRIDVRYQSPEQLQQGQGFKIIEINGIGSESTDIYDPECSLSDAYRKLWRQLRLLFYISKKNTKRGILPTSHTTLTGVTLRHLISETSYPKAS